MTHFLFAGAVAIATICATTVRALPSLGTTAPPTQPPTSGGRDWLDLNKEKYGYFTSEWAPNTMKCFNRVEAVVEICGYGGGKMQYFIRYADEAPLDNEPPLHTPFRRGEVLCYLGNRHVRDNRNASSMHLARENIIFIKSSVNNSGTYALSKEAVWQLEIPQGYGAYLVLNPFNLQKPDNKNCIDYIALDWHDGQQPNVMCGERSDLPFVNTDASRLTIKFVSDESANQGDFHGGLLIYPAPWLKHLLEYYGTNVLSMVEDMARQGRAVGSGMGPLDLRRPPVFDNRKPDGNSDCNSGDSDCENEQPQPDPEPESEPVPDPEPVNKLNMRAMMCFADIVQRGLVAAVQYIGDSSSPQCQKFAEVFLQDDYIAPV